MISVVLGESRSDEPLWLCFFFQNQAEDFFPFSNKKGCLGDAGRFFS